MKNNFYIQQEQAKFMKAKVLEKRSLLPRCGGRKLIYLLQDDFRKAGIKIGRDRFFHFLKSEYLLVKRKKNRTITTRSYHRFNKHPNRIKDISIKHPEQVWVADITYVHCKNETWYLHLITDAYSKKIVGHCFSDNLKTESTLEALKFAFKNKRFKNRKLIHHSDRGFQYCSNNYIQFQNKHKIKTSMTTKYDPYENAVAERINGILKDEFSISDNRLSVEDAKRNIKKAIYNYNNIRPHWSCDLMTPEQAHKSGKFKLKSWSRKSKSISLNSNFSKN